MDEMERYRTRLQRKWERRTTRRNNSGRRVSDYKPPRFWTWGFVVQFVTLIVYGLALLFLAGCAYIKRTIIGG
jgi:hypothetical protein